MQPRRLSQVQQSHLQRLWQTRRSGATGRAESEAMRLSATGANLTLRLDESLTIRAFCGQIRCEIDGSSLDRWATLAYMTWP